MIRFIRILGAGVLVVAVSPAFAQDMADLQRCAKIPDATARLACYDELRERQGPASPAEIASPPSALPPETGVVVEEAQPTPETMSRELGEEQLPAAKRAELEFIGTVRKCEQNARGKWIFWFENGQIWEQRDRDRVRFDDCHFDVTISKDMFGYKMQRAGEKRRIRIGRIKQFSGPGSRREVFVAIPSRRFSAPLMATRSPSSRSLLTTMRSPAESPSSTATCWAMPSSSI